jgi:FNIP Repeat
VLLDTGSFFIHDEKMSHAVLYQKEPLRLIFSYLCDEDGVSFLSTNSDYYRNDLLVRYIYRIRRSIFLKTYRTLSPILKRCCDNISSNHLSDEEHLFVHAYEASHPTFVSFWILMNQSISLISLSTIRTLHLYFQPYCLAYDTIPTLPPSVTELFLVGSYKGPLSPLDIPSSLRTLVLGSDFCYPIGVGVLPDSLTYLEIQSGEDGMSLLPAPLPSCLLTLKLSSIYATLFVEGMLPPSLTYLDARTNPKSLLGSGLPLSLTYLKTIENFYHKGCDSIFANFRVLHTLHLNFCYNSSEGDGEMFVNKLSLLPSLTNLTVKKCHCYHNDLTIKTLPSRLLHLMLIGGYWKVSTVVLSPLHTINLAEASWVEILEEDYVSLSSLKELYLPSAGQVVLLECLPMGLEKLTFGEEYNLPIPIDILPNSLRTLIFGAKYNQVIDVNVLPQGLEVLIFGKHYDCAFEPEVLPNSLKTLVLGDFYEHQIVRGVLPSSLTYLNLGANYSAWLSPGALPDSLIYLACDEKFLSHRQEWDNLPHALRFITCFDKKKFLKKFKDTFAQERYKHIKISQKSHLV